MTNHWSDIDNSSMVFAIGCNPAENHPACMAHINKARFDLWTDADGNATPRGRKAGMIVVDPRKTRTALQADYYVRIRPGTDIAFMNAVANYVMNNAASVAGTNSPISNTPISASIATNMADWHNGTNAVHTSLARTFADDSGVTRTIDAAALANAKYNGVATTAFSGSRGWPKYCDSRVKVAAGASPTDYQRAVLTTTGNTDYLTDKTFRFSNMPVFADNVSDPDCVYQKLKAHVAKYDLTTAAAICGCSEGDIINVAIEMLANSRFNSSDFSAATATPAAAGYKATTLLYAMGGTQHTNGSQNIRAYAVVQTMLGNMGRAGGGINALRGIHNVQGSTDMGLLYDSIPAYSSNPSVGQKYASYSNALFGNRVVNIDGTSAGAKDPYTASQLGLQQRGFYNMTKHWFGDTSADVALTVTGENVTMTGVVWNNLVKGGIKAAPAPVVRDLTLATTYVEGTDYKVDYQVGALMRIATGAITAAQVVVVDYSYSSFDNLYACWPKGNGLDHLSAFRNMETGAIKAAVVWGQNPAVTEPNQSHVRAGLKNLDLLVCVDMFENETAAADRKSTGTTYLLPSCSHVEEAGSVTNSGRWLQWRDRATLPKGNSRADLELMIKFAKALSTAGAFNHIKGAWAGTSLAAADPFTVLFAKYGWDGTGSIDSVSGVDNDGNTLTGTELVAENVFKEMARPLDDASTIGGTFWIYSGTAAASGWNTSKTDVQPAVGAAWTTTNRAKSRNSVVAGAANTYSRYGWAWLLNRRVFYNNGEVPGDVADVFVAPTVLARLFVIDSNTLSDYSLLYRAYNTLKDKPDTGIGTAHVYPGRFPAHTEPYETQYDGTDPSKPNLVAVWGQNTKGTGTGDLVPHVAGRPDLDTLRGQAKDFPLLLTTIRCVEHFQGGPITRNNPWNVELEPEPWIELNSVDARKYNISNGDWVNITTARSNSTTDQTGRTVYTRDGANPTDNFGRGFRARVGVGLQSNQRVAPGVVAIPWHWGDRGLSTGARANDLCIDAADANTLIPEYKACLCKIEKA